MPLTDIGKRDLEALSFAFERKYATTRPQDIPADEKKAEDERYKLIFNARPAEEIQADLIERKNWQSEADLAELRRPVFSASVNWDSRKKEAA